MTRSELKQLIRETIEEISADTARRAADKAKELGRYQQAGRLQRTAQKKDVAAFGGDVNIQKIKIGETGLLSSAEMLKLGKTKDGKPGISIRVKEPNPVAHYYKESAPFTYKIYNLVDNDPHITTEDKTTVKVGRQDRMKLIKAFKSMGVDINPNKINIID